jgi:integrase/recombinase XerD
VGRDPAALAQSSTLGNDPIRVVLREPDDDTPAATQDQRHADARLLPRTHDSYLGAVRGLAKYTRRPPDALDGAEVQRYFEYLVLERKLAPASVRLSYNGIRFLYLEVLAWPALHLEVALPKRPQRCSRAPRSPRSWTPARTPVTRTMLTLC